MSRILLVDDEQDLLWALQYCLRDEGYEVLTAQDGVAALAAARRQRPALVVLDIIMPRLDGLQVCRRLRRDAALATVPILFLTERNGVEAKVRGLDEGGDDYITKPFDLQELKSRIKALLRRGQLASKESPQLEEQCCLTAGRLTLSLRTCQVSIGDQTVQLTPIQFDLLHYLMSHANEVISSRQLLQQVWGTPPNLVDTVLVRWHIKRLRLQIEPDPTQPVYIRTVPRHGYQLTV